MKVFLNILVLLVYAFVMLVIYNTLNVFVLSKFKPNKWIILILAILEFIMIPFLGTSLKLKPSGFIMRYLLPGIFIILFLWFMDLSGWTGRNVKSEKKDKKNDIIKPKPKPNRVKKKKKDD